MSEKDRINTAIHEAGHTKVCYYTRGASKLYKTIVARGGSLGARKHYYD
jgi:ATP-dependent Zn protease